MRRILWFAVPLLLAGGSLLARPQRDAAHSILGVVTDSNGTAIAGASVAAIPIDERGSAGNFGWVHVDDKGRFHLVLKQGRYIIRAKAEADGYPDPSFLLCSDPSAMFPEVTIEQADVSSVRVVLGMRGGVLAGDLRDEATQQAVPNGKLTIRDARQHDAFVELSANQGGHFQFTVPNKPVQIAATAPGYEMARYGNGQEIALSDGEHRSVTIWLTRK